MSELQRNVPIEPWRPGMKFQDGVIVEFRDESYMAFILTSTGSVYTVHRKGETTCNIHRKSRFNDRQLVSRSVKLVRWHWGLNAATSRAEVADKACTEEGMENIRKSGVAFGDVIRRFVRREGSIYIFSMQDALYHACPHRNGWCIVKIRGVLESW